MIEAIVAIACPLIELVLSRRGMGFDRHRGAIAEANLLVSADLHCRTVAG
jgi:hypothetical protein